ncbi:hypothetical protein CEXT_794831 [Caerostris extrusa]|uniref:Uncharacterized protein n=1 Tax=Caerostris extrusa TaxID=172846 RepID=A0AAV4U9R2_CAEEX|nr:hypothetical protein CEXT_794831 [Caerostris extrusa]
MNVKKREIERGRLKGRWRALKNRRGKNYLKTEMENKLPTDGESTAASSAKAITKHLNEEDEEEGRKKGKWKISLISRAQDEAVHSPGHNDA